MRVLIVGNGARDHALAWKIAQSPLLTDLHVAPRSVAMETLATCHDVDVFDFAGLVDLAVAQRIELVVVAFEDLLVGGIADRFEAAGIRCIGPTGDGARIEGSKQFAKELMAEAGVPTARFELFTDADAALAYVRPQDGPIVVKADGLAGGKGAFVCADSDEAQASIREILVDERFGPGQRVIVEEFLDGDETSALFLVDGTHAAALPLAQDYKRLADDDRGPNTGGMGAAVPPPHGSPISQTELLDVAVKPILAALRARGVEYRGVLYVGAMRTADGIRVLEYNCRFGNPETQALVRALDADLLDLIDRTSRGALGHDAIHEPHGAAVAVCLAAPGYPGIDEESAPFPIHGIADAAAQDGIVVFVGPDAPGSNLSSTFWGRGGRVVCIAAHAGSLDEAAARAHAAAELITFEGKHARGDVGRVLQATAG